MSARVAMPVLASRRIAAYRSTLDFGNTRAPSSYRAQPWSRSKHRGVSRTQRHHSPVEPGVPAAEHQTFLKLTYRATTGKRHAPAVSYDEGSAGSRKAGLEAAEATNVNIAPIRLGAFQSLVPGSRLASRGEPGGAAGSAHHGGRQGLEWKPRPGRCGLTRTTMHLNQP